MNKERLTRLADFLRTVPDHKFNLGSWRRDEDGHEGYRTTTSNAQLLDLDCGTAGCAVGWACAMPEFQTQGLNWGAFGPEFKTCGGWNAVREFFDLSGDEAFHLFGESRYDESRGAKPCHVVSRIMEVTL